MTIIPKPILDDVAKEAGVSKSSVSMILSEKEGVSFSQETIDLVLKAAAKVGYVRKKPKFNKGTFYKYNTLLVLSPSMTSPYCSAIIHSIEKEAKKMNLKVIFHNSFRLEEVVTKSFSQIKGSSIYGIFAIMPQHNTKILEEINKTIPVVVINEHGGELNLDTIELDNYAAAELVAKHLVLLGHKDIAYITPKLDVPYSSLSHRLNAVKDCYTALCPNGSVTIKEVMVHAQDALENTSLMYEIGYDLTLKVIENPKITGIIALNDLMAYGVIDALNDKNLMVPQDISVCGFDNLFPSQFKSLSLTTVEHNLDQKGTSAVDLIVSRYEKNLAQMSHTKVTLNHNLVIRRSSAHARTLDSIDPIKTTL